VGQRDGHARETTGSGDVRVVKEHACKVARWSDVKTYRSTLCAAPFNGLTLERGLSVFPRKSVFVEGGQGLGHKLGHSSSTR
jgi:hypothetical protein